MTALSTPRIPRARRGRGGLTLIEISIALALVLVLATLATHNWQRVVQRRQTEFSRQVLSAIDAAKVNWRAAQGDSVSYAAVPTFADLAPYLAIDGRTGITSLAAYASVTGGRTFSINALNLPASCVPALADGTSRGKIQVGGPIVVGPVESVLDPSPAPSPGNPGR